MNLLTLCFSGVAAGFYRLSATNLLSGEKFECPGLIEVNSSTAFGSTSQLNEFLSGKESTPYSLQLSEEQGRKTFTANYRSAISSRNVTLTIYLNSQSEVVAFNALESSLAKKESLISVVLPVQLDEPAREHRVKREETGAQKQKPEQPNDPPKEKSFLQKYFIYIAAGMILLNLLANSLKNAPKP